jgi:hypothetical protein
MRRLLLVACLPLVLAACAAPDRVDTTVESFGGLASMPARATYRFERLPSQLQAPGQARLEALADPALFAAGLRRDDAAPTFGVQVSARSSPVRTGASGASVGLGVGTGGFSGIGIGLGIPIGGGGYARGANEVALILRDIASDRVVYESRARTGASLGDDRVVAALVAAALQGFPQAPPGARNVTVPLATPAAGPAGGAVPATVAPAR